MKKDKYEDIRKLKKEFRKQLKAIAETPVVPPKPLKEPVLSDYNLSDDIIKREIKLEQLYKKKKKLVFFIFLLFIILTNYYLFGILRVLLTLPCILFILIIPFSIHEYSSPIFKKIKQYNKDKENWYWWTELYPKKKVLAYWYNLDGYQFEKEVATVFSANNYIAQVTSKSCDGGVDIILQKNSQTIYVQCKAYKSKIGVAVVRELYGVMQSDSVSQGIIATLKGYTSGAIEFAKDKNIKLLTANDLIDMIN